MDQMNRTCRRCREAIRSRTCGGSAPAEEDGIAAHLDHCPSCRQYCAELEAAASGLRKLAANRVAPSPELRARWVAAVRQDASRQSEALRLGMPAQCGALLSWTYELCRRALWRDRRPILALAPIWLLVVLLRITAPGDLPDAARIAARSPTEILLALKAREEVFAGTAGFRPGTQEAPPSAGPRGGASKREDEYENRQC